MLSNTTQESLSVWNRQLIQERNARGAAGVTVRQLESLIRCGSVGNEATDCAQLQGMIVGTLSA